MSLEISRPAPSRVYNSCRSAPDAGGTTCALATPWQPNPFVKFKRNEDRGNEGEEGLFPALE